MYQNHEHPAEKESLIWLGCLLYLVSAIIMVGAIWVIWRLFT